MTKVEFGMSKNLLKDVISKQTGIKIGYYNKKLTEVKQKYMKNKTNTHDVFFNASYENNHKNIIDLFDRVYTLNSI